MNETPIQYDEIAPHDILIFAFNEKNPNFQSEVVYNTHFLSIQIAQMQDLFMARGYLFVNDALWRMGFDLIPEGQLVGWTTTGSLFPNIQVTHEPLAVRMEPEGFIWNKL